jgi:predicted GH43/DUF377 family glycosyl hydrolase
MALSVKKSTVRLYASPKAVITRFLQFNEERVHHVIERVKSLTDDNAFQLLGNSMKQFDKRHRNIAQTFIQHFNRVNALVDNSAADFSENKKSLLGALFTMEYSIKAAALFNPSIVMHPDQSGLRSGEQRFIMSLRATGEGHISSIVFQTGIITATDILLDDEPAFFTRLQKNEQVAYSKAFVRERVDGIPYFNYDLLEAIPDTFTVADMQEKIRLKVEQHPSINNSAETLEAILDMNYELSSPAFLPINEKVIFPSAKGESMGMEDVRFVRFEDEGEITYYGTYTAYNGQQIKTQLIETKDFDVFRVRTLYGAAVSDKGMALFPEKVNGKYVMISRQGGEMINIMFSENLYNWEDYQLLMEPAYDWEMVQLGNCGSPVKTEKGWLLLTHGVGPVRTYVISAILLDLHNPEKIIGRLSHPLIYADETEREGYVPNVVYTCGYIQHGKQLVIPYAVSDSATGFITVEIEDLLNEMIN